MESAQSSWVFPPVGMSKNEEKRWIELNEPNHQSMFFPKKYYKFNNYNLSFKYLGDTFFKLKAKEVCNFVNLQSVICQFQLGGVSNSYSSLFILFIQSKERMQIQQIFYKNTKIKSSLISSKYFFKYIFKFLFKDRYYSILKFYKRY